MSNGIHVVGTLYVCHMGNLLLTETSTSIVTLPTPYGKYCLRSVPIVVSLWGFRGTLIVGGLMMLNKLSMWPNCEALSVTGRSNTNFPLLLTCAPFCLEGFVLSILTRPRRGNTYGMRKPISITRPEFHPRS